MRMFYKALDRARKTTQLTDLEKKVLSNIPKKQKATLGELTEYRGKEEAEGFLLAAYNILIKDEILRITYQYRLETFP